MLGLLQRRARLHGGRIGRVKREADGGGDKVIGSEGGKRLLIRFIIHWLPEKKLSGVVQSATRPHNNCCLLVCHGERV